MIITDNLLSYQWYFAENDFFRNKFVKKCLHQPSIELNKLIQLFVLLVFKNCLTRGRSRVSRSVNRTVRVLILSRLCPDIPEFSVRCLFVFSFRCFLSGILETYVRCLSVRPDKDETLLSGLSMSLYADVWFDPMIDSAVKIRIGCFCYRSSNVVETEDIVETMSINHNHFFILVNQILFSSI